MYFQSPSIRLRSGLHPKLSNGYSLSPYTVRAGSVPPASAGARLSPLTSAGVGHPSRSRIVGMTSAKRATSWTSAPSARTPGSAKINGKRTIEWYSSSECHS